MALTSECKTNSILKQNNFQGIGTLGMSFSVNVNTAYLMFFHSLKKSPEQVLY